MSNPAIANAILHIKNVGTGYSQPKRWSFVGYNQNARPLVLVWNKAADCSTAAGACVAMAGYPIDLSGTFWTGNQRHRMVAAGAQDLPFSWGEARLGDILWRDGHTEVVTRDSPYKEQTGARIDENGDIYGPIDGNQGNEFATSPLTTNWTRILRFPPRTVVPVVKQVIPRKKTPKEKEIERRRKMMRGFRYDHGNNTWIYVVFDSSSGFYDTFGNGAGAGVMPSWYINDMAAHWETGSWPTLTKGHAEKFMRDLDKKYLQQQALIAALEKFTVALADFSAKVGE